MSANLRNLLIKTGYGIGATFAALFVAAGPSAAQVPGPNPQAAPLERPSDIDADTPASTDPTKGREINPDDDSTTPSPAPKVRAGMTELEGIIDEVDEEARELAIRTKPEAENRTGARILAEPSSELLRMGVPLEVRIQLDGKEAAFADLHVGDRVNVRMAENVPQTASRIIATRPRVIAPPPNQQVGQQQAGYRAGDQSTGQSGTAIGGTETGGTAGVASGSAMLNSFAQQATGRVWLAPLVSNSAAAASGIQPGDVVIFVTPSVMNDGVNGNVIVPTDVFSGSGFRTGGLVGSGINGLGTGLITPFNNGLFPNGIFPGAGFLPSTGFIDPRTGSLINDGTNGLDTNGFNNTNGIDGVNGVNGLNTTTTPAGVNRINSGGNMQNPALNRTQQQLNQNQQEALQRQQRIQGILPGNQQTPNGTLQQQQQQQNQQLQNRNLQQNQLQNRNLQQNQLQNRNLQQNPNAQQPNTQQQRANPQGGVQGAAPQIQISPPPVGGPIPAPTRP